MAHTASQAVSWCLFLLGLRERPVEALNKLFVLGSSVALGRCTGAALSVALGLVEATCPQSSVGEARREVLCRAFRAASAWRPRYSRQTCPRQLTDPIERQERDSGTVRTSLVGTQSLKTITVLLSSVDFNGFQHQTVVM